MKGNVKILILCCGVLIAALGLMSLLPREAPENAGRAAAIQPAPSIRERPAPARSALRGNKKMQLYLALKRR
jgi:hypothetical protein